MLCGGPELRPVIEAGLGSALPAVCEFIGKWRDGRVVNAAAFAHWVGHDAEVSLWADGPLHRDFLKRLGRYAFDELGCTRITARVAANNPWAEQMPRLGFVCEGRMRHALDGTTDTLIFGLLRSDYRYV